MIEFRKFSAAGAAMVIAAALSGSSAQAQQPLDAKCANSATQATGYVPGSQPVPPPSGARVRGAAAGAVGGAIVGDAGKGAAVGTVAGGVATRHRRREARRDNQAAQTAWQNSYNACLQQPR